MAERTIKACPVCGIIYTVYLDGSIITKCPHGDIILQREKPLLYPGTRCPYCKHWNKLPDNYYRLFDHCNIRELFCGSCEKLFEIWCIKKDEFRSEKYLGGENENTDPE